MNTMQSAQVMVQDDDTLATNPTINVATEHLPNDAIEATFYIVADSAPHNKNLEVLLEYNYEADDPSNPGSKIDLRPNWKRTTVLITAGKTFGSFTEAVNESVSTPVALTGTLKVRLVDGDNYDLGTPSASGLTYRPSNSN